MKISIAAVTVFLALPLSLSAQSWSLEPCDDADSVLEARQTYVAAVKAATPDTPRYTPHVFPGNGREVLENFRAFHLAAYADVPLEHLSAEEQELLQALADDRLRFDVLKVANWTPLRCGVPKARLSWWLLRMFDASTGTELARATIDEIGHVGRLRLRPPESGFNSIPSLTRIRADIEEIVGRVRDAQYVTTWGTLKCDELSPCVATRRGGEVFIYRDRDERLFAVDIASPPVSFQRDLSVANRAATLRNVRESGRWLVSLGSNRFAFARVLSGGSVKNR